MSEDKLRIFISTVQCPVCGCIESKGSSRCPECGTFHSGMIMEERKAPTPEEIRANEYTTVVDPSNYSIGPHEDIPVESFEESSEVITWDGGNADFTFDEDEEEIIRPFKISPKLSSAYFEDND